MSLEISTPRLRLVAGTLEIAVAEMEDRAWFADLIGARVPSAWPPETLADARRHFRALYEKNPEWAGWLVWYAIRKDQDPPVLCGSVGFLGPADGAGMVEIGYSVLKEFQGDGLASEMTAGLLSWALGHSEVRCVEAETEPANAASIGVLERNGFRQIGPGNEPDTVRYRLDKEGSSR